MEIPSVYRNRVADISELYQSKLKQLNSPSEQFSKLLNERMGIGSSEETVTYVSAMPANLATIKNIDTAKVAGVSDNAAMAARKAQYQPLVAAASKKYGLSEALINAVIQAESSFRADAVSSVGAQGLMQLMPGTAREMGVTNSFDPVQNIDGGCKYLTQMIERFGGDLRLALAAYNCGPARVSSLGIESSNDASQYARLSDGVRSYVSNVLKYAGVA